MAEPDKNQAGWIAEAKLYSELPNPSWGITKALVKRIESTFTKLKKQPHCGIPAFAEDVQGYSGITLSGPDGHTWHIFPGSVIRFRGSLIEFVEDTNRTIENMIFRSMPSDTFEEVRHFLVK